jgi:hypothetical protein
MSSFKWPPDGGGGSSYINSVLDTNSIDLTVIVDELSANLNLSAAAADAGFQPVALSIEADGLQAQIADSDILSVFSVTDTNSINLTLTSGDISADLNLSAAAADAGFFNATTSIEADGLQVQINIAATAQTGVLSSTDWNTFNNKQAAGNYITALTGDVVATGPGSVAATIQSGVIVNSMVNASAAIDFSKLASLTSGNILVGSAGNVPTSVAMSGDVTISNAGVTAIGLNKVTNAQLAQMPTLTIKGNNTGGTADSLDLTVSQVNTMLGTFANPMTTAGDIIYGGASGVPTRLAQGTKGQPLVAQVGTNTPGYSWGSTNAVSSADYTITDTDGYTTIAVSTGASDRTVTLPTLGDNQNRTIMVIKTDTGAGKVIIDGEGAETINSESNYYIFKQNDSVTITAYSAGWVTNIKERVFFSAESDTAGSIGTSATDQVYEDVLEDSRSAYDSGTGIWTAPRNGYYDVQASVQSASVNLTTAQRFSGVVSIDGGTASPSFQLQRMIGVGASNTFQSEGARTVYLTKNQTVRITAVSNVATNRSVVPSANFFTIKSVD